MPALTAKERFLIELRSYQAGEKPDLTIRRTTPDEQRTEFNHYIRLFNKVNRKLGAYTVVVSSLVEKLDVRFALMLSTGELALRMWELAKLIPAGKQARAEAILEKSFRPIDLPWDKEEKQGSWLDESDRLLDGVRRELFNRWQEVQAIEAVLEEVAAEFGGEDLALPDIRGFLAEAKTKLGLIGEFVAEERPALVLDGPPLTDVRAMLPTD